MEGNGGRQQFRHFRYNRGLPVYRPPRFAAAHRCSLTMFCFRQATAAVGGSAAWFDAGQTEGIAGGLTKPMPAEHVGCVDSKWIYPVVFTER